MTINNTSAKIEWMISFLRLETSIFTIAEIAKNTLIFGNWNLEYAAD